MVTVVLYEEEDWMDIPSLSSYLLGQSLPQGPGKNGDVIKMEIGSRCFFYFFFLVLGLVPPSPSHGLL